MSMKPVGGVEIFGPASNPQKFHKGDSTQRCAQALVGKDRPRPQNSWLDFLDPLSLYSCFFLFLFHGDRVSHSFSHSSGSVTPEVHSTDGGSPVLLMLQEFLPADVWRRLMGESPP